MILICNIHKVKRDMLLVIITESSETNSPPIKSEAPETKPGNIILTGYFQLVY